VSHVIQRYDWYPLDHFIHVTILLVFVCECFDIVDDPETYSKSLQSALFNIKSVVHKNPTCTYLYYYWCVSCVHFSSFSFCDGVRILCN
jgi:hypothetical protein